MRDNLRKLGIRAEADLRNEKLGFKIREAQVAKIPYMLVVGEKEVQEHAWLEIRGGDCGHDPGRRGGALQERRNVL